jgi:hypothetical protein
MGLLMRTRFTSSNREVAVTLSVKGSTLVAGLIPLAREFETCAIAGLSPDELAVLKRCLRRTYSNMKNTPAAAVRSRPKRVAV